MTPPVPPLPDRFLERMQSLLRDEYSAFLASYGEAPLSGLRVNTLKISLPDFLTLAEKVQQHESLFWLVGDTPTPIPWAPSGLIIPPNTRPGKHPLHAAGLYYLQDPSAMAAAEALAPRAGERVLDLAAAPGGKTTHLAALMQNQGLLVANEIHPQRAWDLAENIERCGVRIACITNETPARLADHFGAFFDRVLLDAPCSGEGMFRKSPSARAQWSVDQVPACAARQSAILHHAAHLVRPGGWLLYSTCTFSPEENEQVIAKFLDAFPTFSLQPIPARPGFSPGRPEWLTGAQRPDLENATRLWPQRGGGEGHFLALLRRSEQAPADAPLHQPAPPYPTRLPQAVRDYFTAFCQETLLPPYPEEHLGLSGTYLYQISPSLPDLGSLKVIHPGWWLGIIKKNRFEPAHALALGLPTAEPEPSRLANRTLNLPLAHPASDHRILAYLQGNSLAYESDHIARVSAASSGWGLVCLAGYPLGWGKFVQGVVKNAYPRGLRLAAA